MARFHAILTRVPSSSPTETRSFFCKECQCPFSEEAAFKKHSLQTHSDKPYKCDRCQASFRYKGNLASHKTVHTGIASPGGHVTAALRSAIDRRGWFEVAQSTGDGPGSRAMAKEGSFASSPRLNDQFV